jgi:hypothetical protein
MRTRIFALAAVIIFALARVPAAYARGVGAAPGLGTNYETVYDAP